MNARFLKFIAPLVLIAGATGCDLDEILDTPAESPRSHHPDIVSSGRPNVNDPRFLNNHHNSFAGPPVREPQTHGSTPPGDTQYWDWKYWYERHKELSWDCGPNHPETRDALEMFRKTKAEYDQWRYEQRRRNPGYYR
jgi:hypothetical protein